MTSLCPTCCIISVNDRPHSASGIYRTDNGTRWNDMYLMWDDWDLARNGLSGKAIAICGLYEGYVGQQIVCCLRESVYQHMECYPGVSDPTCAVF